MTITYIVLLFLFVFIGLILTIAFIYGSAKAQKNKVITYGATVYFLASVFAFIKLAVEAIISIK